MINEKQQTRNNKERKQTKNEKEEKRGPFWSAIWVQYRGQPLPCSLWAVLFLCTEFGTIQSITHAKAEIEFD